MLKAVQLAESLPGANTTARIGNTLLVDQPNIDASVPAGVDYLNGDIVWDAQAKPTAVFETLFDPLGRITAYSLLGIAHSGRGHIEVRLPTPGTWTVAIFTVRNAFVYSGTVNFAYSTLRVESGGSVSPASVSLNPGQSATFQVSVTAANDPGDHVSTLRLSTGGADDGALPIIIRSLVPINGRGGASFSGVLNGGGDVFNAGQQFTYQFDVPGDESSLNLAVNLRDPNYDVRAFLTDPAGEPLDIQSTAPFDANGKVTGFGRNLQIFQRAASAGRWTPSLLVFTPIDGAHLTEPFTANIDFNDPRISAENLPHSLGVRLADGVPVKATITSTNTGVVAKDYFADPRLRGRVLQQLLGADVNAVSLPLSLAAQPNWLVPTATDLLMVAAQGTVPIVGELSAANGDPDVLGVSLPGNVSVAQLRAPEVAPGFFFGVPEAMGPFPPTGVGSGATVNLAAVARTNLFDRTITSDTGDLWAFSVDPTATYSPLTLQPGQSGTITLTITPSAESGRLVRGFIGVDTFNLDTLSGDEVIRLPYEYTVH